MLWGYTRIFLSLLDLTVKLFTCCVKDYGIVRTILEIIGFIIWAIFIPVYIVIPLYPHFIIKRIYYSKFLSEIKNQYNNKLIYYFIILGQIIFSLVFMLTFFIMNYIIAVILLPIYFLIIHIIFKIYRFN